jgi:hypothetical protein
MNSSRTSVIWSLPFFSLLLLVQLWTAHAVVFFPHEYAHSFTAWLLGWKSNPLALYYAHPTLKVLLAQMGIDQNVNEVPIFASGHGRDAALIAAAGMVIGNGLITYPLSRLGYAMATRRHLRGWAMFFYWTTVASVGNFIDYVPVRTFSPTGDMASVERGLGWSPLTVLIILGIPTAWALIYFLFRIQPSSVSWLFPASAPRRVILVLLTGAVLWGFYGAAGLVEGGPLAYQMSKVSVFVLLPLVTLISWFVVQRRAERTLALAAQE